MTRVIQVTLFLYLIVFTSCSEINTDDPREAYTYWAGEPPARQVKVLKGQYWQSAHWTHEYILYLNLKTTKKWWTEFVKRNGLLPTEEFEKPSDAPDWFNPNHNMKIYKRDNFSDSRYFIDFSNGECYIYDSQL